MDKIFKCEQCDVRTTTLRALISHYRNIHGGVPDSCNEMKEKEVPCPDCGKEVKNLTRHKNFCSVSKMAQRSSGAKSSVSSPSTAMASLQLSQEGDQIVESRVVTEEEFLQLFKDFCIKVEGNKESTYKQYSQRLQQFARFHSKNGPEFKFGKTLDFQSCSSIDDYLFIPTSFQWIDSYSSNENKAGAVAAYIKLIDFFKFQVQEVGRHLKKQLKIDLKDGFDDLRDNARRIQKRVSADIIPDRKERRVEAENLAETEEELEIPMETMKELVDFYRDCNYRIQMYEKLQDMDDAMNFGGETATKIRNFLMLEILIECGGQRPEVIRNLTIGDLYKEGKDNQDGDMRVLHVSKHKTSKNYGIAQVFVPKSLHDLLCQYHEKVRGLLAHLDEDKTEQAKQFLFVAQGTGEPLQKLDQSCKIFMNVTQTKYKIFPYCFRHLVAHLGQASDDPMVREKFPTHMNHSQSTAVRDYVSQEVKRKEHSKMLAVVYGRSKNLPVSDSMDEKIEETRAQMNTAAKKAKLDATVEKKEENFVAGPRKVFSPSERDVIIKAFKDVPQSNLKKSEYDSALEMDQQFKELVQRHKEKGKADSEIFKQVQNSFRSTRRK